MENQIDECNMVRKVQNASIYSQRRKGSGWKYQGSEIRLRNIWMV